MTEGKTEGEGDRFLLAHIQRGSADAFQRLVERFSGRLKAFAARRLKGSGIDPEDAVQETFLALLRNVHRLGEVRSLQAYLFTILRRRIADLARERGPLAGAVPLKAADSSGGYEPESPEGTPSTYARRDEARDARRTVLADILETVLSRLKSERSFRDLKVIELLFATGSSQQDAARLADTSEPTVSRVRRALLDELAALTRRHPQAAALEDLPTGDEVGDCIRDVWHENLFSCMKRSTLGSYALGVLDDDWMDYVRFHLEVAHCEYCAAHLAEIEEGESISPRARERIYASSIGFLRK